MVAVKIPPSGKQYFYFGTLCPEVEKAGERYQPLPGWVRALPTRRAVSRDQTAAPTKRHSPAARPRVLRDKSRRRCWLELPLGSDCWSSAAGAKPAHEQAKGQHEAHVVLNDGSIGSGGMLRIQSWYGELDIHFDGEILACNTDEQETWEKEVLDAIQ